MAFGYNDPKPTLEKLVITMFVTYAAKSIHTDMPQAWKPFISYKSGNIIAFMDNLMNSYLYGTRFDEISEIIYNAINGKNYLEKMEVERMSNSSVKKLSYNVPLWHKPNLSIEEASIYSNIGTGKLYEMTEKQDCPFVLWIGSRRMIKRKIFEEYIANQYSI